MHVFKFGNMFDPKYLNKKFLNSKFINLADNHILTFSYFPKILNINKLMSKLRNIRILQIISSIYELLL